MSVVVPFFDEADSVLPLVDELVAALGHRISCEILLVDDGSRDATPKRLEEAAAAHRPRVRVFCHALNRGQSAALVTGVEAATAQWIATMDGDGQNDPADIPRLLEELRRRREDVRVMMVAGWRRERKDTWIKRVSSRVANAVRGRLLGDATPDTGCGLKVFSREVFLRLPRFDHMHRFLPALFIREGCRVVSVPVTHRPRLRGRSKYGIHNRLWVGIADLVGVLWLQRRALPRQPD